MKAKALLLGVLLTSSTLLAQQPATTASRTRPAVEFLASDRLEGREAGSPGERLAGDYIAMQLARVGVKPLPGQSSLFLPFEFTAGSRDGGSTLTLRRNGAAPQTFTGVSLPIQPR